MEKDATATMKAKLRKQKGLKNDQKNVEIKLQEFRGVKKPITPKKVKLSSLEQRMNELTERMKKLNDELRKRMSKPL